MKNPNENSSGLIDDVSCAILCGGKSTRMGQNKAEVLLAGRRIISHCLENAGKVFSEIMISVRQDAGCDGVQGHEKVADELELDSPLSGIHATLVRSSTRAMVAAAVDMPFVKPELFRLMAEMSKGADVLIPQIDDKLEPLLAVYSKDCIGPIEKHVKLGGKKVICFFEEVNVRYLEKEQIEKVDPDFVSFFNINFPLHLEAAEKMLLKGF